MDDRSEKHSNALKQVVYEIPGMTMARVQRDVEYHRSTGHGLTFDLYRADARESPSPLPVVLFVAGVPDVGVRTPLGCCFKDMERMVSLAQLVSASGMAAVAYTSHRPTDDIQTVLDYLASHAAELNIDASRVGLWACSARGPLALSTLTRHPQRFRVGVLSNVYTLLIVRAGQDEMPDLNPSLDRFVSAALAHTLPATVVNHSDAPHAFEMNHDSDDSRAIIRQMLAFMRSHLT